ncbi:hypothetical protein NpPPO83_00011467 [Neofusicoccum parvum]|uniref:Uncharacterized protein n=1 Tax=Neofusicoccum parvum TaxID=310453 RepID=A0ACB5S271_9PEZI|nr:hypothetical protein NpPPO83_00011467 [Neofusicoccum parvum]
MAILTLLCSFCAEDAFGAVLAGCDFVTLDVPAEADGLTLTSLAFGVTFEADGFTPTSLAFGVTFEELFSAVSCFCSFSTGFALGFDADR